MCSVANGVYKQLICLMWKYHEIELNTCSKTGAICHYGQCKARLVTWSQGIYPMLHGEKRFFFCCCILGRALDASSVDKNLPAGISLKSRVWTKMRRTSCKREGCKSK